MSTREIDGENGGREGRIEKEAELVTGDSHEALGMEMLAAASAWRSFRRPWLWSPVENKEKRESLRMGEREIKRREERREVGCGDGLVVPAPASSAAGAVGSASRWCWRPLVAGPGGGGRRGRHEVGGGRELLSLAHDEGRESPTTVVGYGEMGWIEQVARLGGIALDPLGIEMLGQLPKKPGMWSERIWIKEKVVGW